MHVTIKSNAKAALYGNRKLLWQERLWLLLSKSMWFVSLHLIGLILQFEYNLFVIGHPTNGSLLSAMQHNTESGVSQR